MHHAISGNHITNYFISFLYLICFLNLRAEINPHLI